MSEDTKNDAAEAETVAEEVKTKKAWTPARAVSTSAGIIVHGTEITEEHVTKEQLAALKKAKRVVQAEIVVEA